MRPRLKRNRGMVGRPACRRRLDAYEPEIGQIERVDKGINYTNGIALLDPFIEAFRQQRRLACRTRCEAARLTDRDPVKRRSLVAELPSTI